MSGYEDDHPTTADPDSDSRNATMTLEEILEELEAGEENIRLVGPDGAPVEGIVEMLSQAAGSRTRASPSYVSSLRPLSAKDVHPDEACGICQTPLTIILDEEEHQLALDSPAVDTESLGVVRIGQTCMHTFCRRDAARWLSKSNSCPLCRSPCDPSVGSSPASGTSSGTPADNINARSGLGINSGNGLDMRAMLEQMFGSGSGRAPPPTLDEDRYSSMYS